MKARRVLYHPEARADLDRILDWLAGSASPLAAIGIIEDLEGFIGRLDLAAERGTRRDDLRPNLRILGHGNATIAVAVDERTVYILRIFYGGQDWEAAMKV
ncbi:MAG TPA: type II toxin-antitoxin system RelE/ParE family toxin [Devosia sp.]|jgi:toxin ParE1/3/4|nr:type II toxin-antitoxin system RelE/ParE family toxin [Devosia sp.]